MSASPLRKLTLLTALIALCGVGCTCSDTRIHYLDGGEDDGGDGGDGDIDAGHCDWEPWGEGIVGGQVYSVTFDPRTPGRVYATTGSKVFRSSDSGQTWELVSRDKNLRRLAFPGGDPEVVLGASASGVAKSKDGGLEWRTTALNGLNVRALVAAPSSPLRVYAAIDLVGVVRALDGGESWESVVHGMTPSRIDELAVHPTDPDVVLAVAQEADPTCGSGKCSILMRTDNGGDDWMTVVASVPKTAGALAFCDANPDVVYASVGDRVLRSENGGAAWEPSGLGSNLDVQGLAIAGDDCERVYAASFAGGVYRTDDGGAEWHGPFKDGIADLTASLSLDGASVDPTNADRVFVVARSGAFVSTDAGETWTPLPELGTPPARSLHMSSIEGGEGWLATWGSGLWHRGADEAAWEHTSVTEFPVDFVQIARPSPLDSMVVFASNRISTDGANTFDETELSNVMDVDFDPERTNTIGVATQLGGVELSANGGTSFEPTNGNLTAWETENGEHIDVRAIRFVPGQEETIVIGTNGRGIYLTTNDGDTWTSVGDFETSLVDCLVWDESANRMYACVRESGVARSTDNGATWTLVSDGLPAMTVSGLAHHAGSMLAGTSAGIYELYHDDDTWKPLGDASCVPGGLSHPAAAFASPWIIGMSSGDGPYRYLITE